MARPRPSQIVLLLAIAGVLALAWLARASGSPDPVHAPPAPVAVVAAPSAATRFRPTAAVRHLRVIEHGCFTVGYDEERKDPAWVVYDLDGPIAFPGPSPERPATFATDFATAAHVSHGDYTRSGFDRGHLCPAYAMFSRHGPAAFAATFVMSNVIPQPHGLNAGVWEGLEEDIAGRAGRGGGWAESLGHLTVIDGPIHGDRPERLATGVAIPIACFAMILDLQEGTGGYRALAFRIPNQAAASGPLRRYLTTVRRLEQETGLDLLAGADQQVRAAVEDAHAEALWPGLVP